MAQLLGNPYADRPDMTQAQAMLAVAHELRTANLLALLQPIRTAGSGEIVPEEPFAVKILEQISERLGLE